MKTRHSKLSKLAATADRLGSFGRMKRERWLRSIPAFAYAALIFAISSLSQPEFPTDLFPLRDKGVHVTEYAALGFFCAFALFSRQSRTRALVVTAWTISTLYGVSDELHQYIVPGRSSELGDVVADAVGSAIGVAIHWFTSPGEYFLARRNKE